MDRFSEQILDNKDKYINQHAFLKRIDIGKFVDVIKLCSSEQINNLRISIGTVYSFSNINEFFMDDKLALVELKNGINKLLLSENDICDKIKRLQLLWFSNNLSKILERLG